MDDWPLNLEELEEAAAERLDSVAYDYFRSGSGDERTLARNREAFAEVPLLPRVLRDVSEVSTGIELLGRPAASPIVVAPTAFHRLAHPDGEAATARGVAAAGSIFCLSSLGNTPVDEVAAASSGRRWFQLYVFRDRGFTRSLVEGAVAAGFEAIVLTVDAPVLGRREPDIRNGFELPEGIEIACAGERAVAPPGESGLAHFFATQLDPSLDWSALSWLCEISELPVLVKGIHRPDDAERAIAHGAAGVIVSNHGGRQLDGAPASIEMLPAVAERLNGSTTLLVDGGVRRGVDVARALCLGADAVLIGRPILWALALGGSDGVQRVLEDLTRELGSTMMLLGARDPGELDRDLLA